MLKLGIIGTGAIAHQFIAACHLEGHYKLSAVYSRRLETAQVFAQNYGQMDLYTDLYSFVHAALDVIYIASPNSLHYQHALAAIEAGKHVIVEKPAFSNPTEFAAVKKLAQDKKVLLFEAARNYHEKSFDIIKAFLAGKTIYGASFHYAQYSSRMKNLNQGIYDNAFQSQMSGGALVDLGIYELYAAYRLFGQPMAVRYSADLLESGVDISGTGQLIYDRFQVTMVVRKNAQSSLASEIYTDQGTLVLNHIQGIATAHFHALDGQVTELPIQAPQHLMLEEAQAFAQLLLQVDPENGRYQELLTVSEQVNQTLYAMRQDANIHFEADHHD